MAQTGFTPIQIYYSTTSSNLPLAANLTNGELAINSADGKLFYKDSGGTVQTLASQNLFASQTANYVYASPNGSAGVPTFRALVAADIPALSGSYVPYTGASSAVDLNAKTLVNVANLGVGTATVPTILARVVGDNGAVSRIAMRGYSSDANSSSIRVTKFRGSAGTPQAPLSGDSLGKFELAGYGTTSSDGYAQASFEGVATENWGAAARGAKTLIKVTPNTTITQVTAVTVDQDSKATFAGALSVTGHTTFEGVTSTGATGTGKLVYDTSPTLTTPTIGVATATSINKMAITAPATSSTLAVADGKTHTVNNSIALSGTDGTTMTFPATSATIARTDAANTFTGVQAIPDNITSTKSLNGMVNYTITNANAGISAESAIILSNGTNSLKLVQTGTGATTYGAGYTGYAIVQSTAANGYVLMANTAGAHLKIAAGQLAANFDFSITGLAITGELSTTALIKPQQATTAGAPAYVKGAIYFDTTLNKLRVGGATAWETITSV
jgi:hypothetical protein